VKNDPRAASARNQSVPGNTIIQRGILWKYGF